jgi:hypothetical protein
LIGWPRRQPHRSAAVQDTLRDAHIDVAVGFLALGL